MLIETPKDQRDSLMELIVTNTGDQPIDITIKITGDDDDVVEFLVSFFLTLR